MDQRSMTTQGNCVTINVYVKCDECDKERAYERPCSDKEHEKEERESCVIINVFVECEED